MKELNFLKIINDTLSKNTFIGDDCAYLKGLGIVITQDSLVQDIHFSSEFATPYQIGYKAITVNLSDVFASGATPKYLTISLSLPKNIDDNFIKEFYRACDDLSKTFDFEIVGGDITGSDKIYISVCAVGITANRKISSRKNAKVGDYVIATGNHGSSAAGLWLLQNDIRFVENYRELCNSHLMPEPQKDFSLELSGKMRKSYAMMDTSDGLVDALFKISESSNVMIKVDFDKIAYDKSIEKIAILADVDFRDWVLYGGEDYQMVACINADCLKMLNSDYRIIGKVCEKSDAHFVEINFGDSIKKVKDLEKTFNHFKDEG